MKKRSKFVLTLLIFVLIPMLTTWGCSGDGEQASTTVDVNMKPGTYTGSGQGFSYAEDVEVSVTVDEISIQKIEVSEENGETKTILQSVIDNMIPRIIEQQSVAVDSITGATLSSSAVKAAVTEALTKALESGGSSASAIEAFKKEPAKVTGKTETVNTGVLVVGMGGSGTATALRAAEVMYEADPDSVDVLAIDKAGKYGGTSALTTEIFGVNAPKFIEEHNDGKEYFDKADLRKAWLEYTEGDAKTEIVDLLLDNSGKVIDWLIYDHGYQLSTPKRGFTEADVYEVKYQFLPNDTGANKEQIGEYFDRIYDDYTKLGGKYMLETEAYELILEDDKVTGVKARGYDGTEYEILADAVVLATGGFAGNGEMTTKYLSDEYYPLSGEWKLYGSMQNDGKMIQEAIDNGAGTYNIGIPPMVHMAGTPTFLTQFDKNVVEGQTGFFTGRPAIWSSGDLPLNMVVANNFLAVDTNGKRFASETGLAFLDPWKSGPKYFSIWSTDQVDKIKEEGLSPMEGMVPGLLFLGHQTPIPAQEPMENIEEVLQAGIDAGFVYKADTISELAEQIGVKPESLEGTVQKYNEYCQNGVDEEFNKPADYLEKVGNGPYYAIVGASYCYSTCGGLDIDENFNVLKSDGTTPIENLYAVGTDSMGVLFSEKKPYVTFGGAANGWAYTSGYLCGEIVADKSLNK